MNLMMEYRRRRDDAFVLGSINGYAFFDDCCDNPKLICLTSCMPRSMTVCGMCSRQNSGLIVEFMTPQIAPDISTHDHVSPDTDIQKYIDANLNLGPIKQHCVHNSTDIEEWLWKFFMIGSRKYWRHHSDYSMAPFEEMTIVAMHDALLFHKYFTIYQQVTIDRHYLLLD